MSAVNEVIDILENAPRMGAEKDEPEGTRYIQISDTLAKQLVTKLKEYLDDLWSDSVDAMGEDA